MIVTGLSSTKDSVTFSRSFSRILSGCFSALDTALIPPVLLDVAGQEARFFAGGFLPGRVSRAKGAINVRVLVLATVG
jgi:hypothetical protein